MASATPHASQIPNILPPSSHRLPTVSVAQALHDLDSSRARCISTGLRELDAELQGKEVGVIEDGSADGVSRGKVTEIWGPPGVGKTALGMQLTASALHAGEGVVWVDASHPLSGLRLTRVLTSFKPSTPANPPELVDVGTLNENLTHFSTPTLAHLLALLSHEITNYEVSNTSLIIIDSFSTLISIAFPRMMNSNPNTSKPGGSNTSRKLPMLQHVVNLFQKLAATRNLAIVVLSQCVTKMRPGAGPVLMPAVSTTAWEQGLGCRVMLFRDWGWDDEERKVVTDVRFAEVVKADGTVILEGKRKLVGFSIDNTGLRPLALPSRRPQRETPPTPHAVDLASASAPALARAIPRKRKLSAADLEIPDSENEGDEDYGWAEEDEEDMPPMPPQWQGSEDILLPGEGEQETEGEEEEKDADGLESRNEEEIPAHDAGDAASKTRLGVEIGDSEDEGW